MSIRTQAAVSNFISWTLVGILIFLGACLIGFHQTQNSLGEFDQKFYLKRGVTYVILQTKHHLEKSQLSCELALRSRMEEDLLNCLRYSDAASSQVSGSDEIVASMGQTGVAVKDLAMDLRARFAKLENTDDLNAIVSWVPKAKGLTDDLARMETILGQQNEGAMDKLHLNLSHLLKLTWLFTICLIIMGGFFLGLIVYRHNTRKLLLEVESERNSLNQALINQREKLFLLSKETILFQLAKEIAIEVNLPLTSALNRLSKIRMDQTKEDRPDLNVVESHLWRISEKLKILTCLYRNPLSKPELQKLELTQLILETKLLFESRFSHSNVTFNISPQSVPYAKPMVERSDTLRALYALFENALEAQREDRSVELVVLRDESAFKIEVRNPGEELSFVAQSRLFEPFFTTKKDKSGLSLVSVRHALRTWGADVLYRHDQGTNVFWIVIPILE